MEQLFSLAKAITYGTCAVVALAYYVLPGRRERMPQQFSCFVAGLLLMALGESLGHAWHSHLALAPAAAAAGNAALIAGTFAAVGSVTAMSVTH